MKRILLCGSALALLSLISPAHAEEVKTDRLGGAETYIAVDEETGRIVFVVKGETEAVLDAQGLHVRENIDYGGAITDEGRSGFDAHAAQSTKESHDTE
jgi:hypothetical protein